MRNWVSRTSKLLGGIRTQSDAASHAVCTLSQYCARSPRIQSGTLLVGRLLCGWCRTGRHGGQFDDDAAVLGAAFARAVVGNRVVVGHGGGFQALRRDPKLIHKVTNHVGGPGGGQLPVRGIHGLPAPDRDTVRVPLDPDLLVFHALDRLAHALEIEDSDVTEAEGFSARDLTLAQPMTYRISVTHCPDWYGS